MILNELSSLPLNRIILILFWSTSVIFIILFYFYFWKMEADLRPLEPMLMLFEREGLKW